MGRPGYEFRVTSLSWAGKVCVVSVGDIMLISVVQDISSHKRSFSSLVSLQAALAKVTNLSFCG